MDKSRKIRMILAFLFGLVFIVTGMCLFGIINVHVSLAAGLSNPACWIYGLIFGTVLAFGARKGKPVNHGTDTDRL